MQKLWSCVFFSLFITKFQGIKNTNWFCSHLWNLATKGRGNRIEMQKVFAHFSLSLSRSRRHTRNLAVSLSFICTRTHTHAQKIHRFVEIFVISFCCPSSPLSLSLSLFLFLSLSLSISFSFYTYYDIIHK